VRRRAADRAGLAIGELRGELSGHAVQPGFDHPLVGVHEVLVGVHGGLGRDAVRRHDRRQGGEPVGRGALLAHPVQGRPGAIERSGCGPGPG
jgi:hypothetical protein